MDKEAFFKRVQQYVAEIPLIVLGSGASVAFGVPTMGQLADKLKRDITYTEGENAQKWKSFLAELNSTNDLEKALHNATLNNEITEAIISTTWNYINEKDKEAFQWIYSKPSSHRLIDLLKYFEKTAKKRISIVTTNYDRLAEYAVSYTNSLCYTGFTFNHIGHHISDLVDSKYQELRDYRSIIKVWKIHGSLDWFLDSDNEPYSIYHSNEIPANHIPCIVTPGIEKYRKTYDEPFRSIMTSIDKDFNSAVSFLCIGYGFNDEHVQTYLIKKVKKDGVPIVLITKQISDQAKELIINGQISKYILIEEDGHNSKVFTSDFPSGFNIDGNYWSLDGFLKILNPQ